MCHDAPLALLLVKKMWLDERNMADFFDGLCNLFPRLPFKNFAVRHWYTC